MSGSTRMKISGLPARRVRDQMVFVGLVAKSSTTMTRADRSKYGIWSSRSFSGLEILPTICGRCRARTSTLEWDSSELQQRCREWKPIFISIHYCRLWRRPQKSAAGPMSMRRKMAAGSEGLQITSAPVRWPFTKMCIQEPKKKNMSFDDCFAERYLTDIKWGFGSRFCTS